MESRDCVLRRGANVHANPRVSVVTPAYAPAWLDEALESVRDQTFRDLEIVVVDDGSPEPVAPARADDVVLVRQANAGPGGARNRGVQVARGELIALLDADDRMAPEKLERQVAYHQASPDLVMSCTDIVLSDGETRRAASTVRERARVTGDRIPFDRLFYENCIVCSTVMMHRSAFLQTHGMKPHCRLGEDYGLWLRLAMIGPVGYVAEPLVERRQHAGSLMSLSMRDGSWFEQERFIYDEFLREHPHLEQEEFVSRAFARLEFQGAWAHLARGEWAHARRALQRSLSYRPMQPKAWFDFARAAFHVRPSRPPGMPASPAERSRP